MMWFASYQRTRPLAIDLWGWIVVLIVGGMFMSLPVSRADDSLSDLSDGVSLPAVRVENLKQLSTPVNQIDLGGEARSQAIPIDLSSPVFQREAQWDMEYHHREAQRADSLSQHLATYWGEWLVAVVEQRPDDALSLFDQWITDWNDDYRTHRAEKERVRQQFANQLIQLGAYPLAQKVLALGCEHHQSCLPEGLGGLSALYPEPWPEGSVREYLEDLGHTLAIFTSEAPSGEGIAEKTTYPSILKDALRAWESLALGDSKEAITQFQWVTRQAPEHPLAWVGLGQAYAEEHQWAKAEEAFSISKNHDVLSQMAWDEAKDRTAFLTGLEQTAKGEAFIAKGQSYPGRMEQMVGYELLGRYPEIMAHIRQYDCLHVGPLTHRLWAAQQVQAYGLWPDHPATFLPQRFQDSRYRYAAALLQARSAVLTGPTQQAQSFYQQALTEQPDGREALLGLASLEKSAGMQQIQTKPDHTLTMATSGVMSSRFPDYTQQWPSIPKGSDLDEAQPAWTLAEKQYVGNALRRVFISKYLMHVTLGQFYDRLKDSQPSVATLLNRKEAMPATLSQPRRSISHLYEQHQDAAPPDQWALAHDLMGDMLRSDEQYLQQLAATVSSPSEEGQNMGTVQAVFQMGESKALDVYFNYHVLRHLRAMPILERQRFLFEYELPVELSAFQQLLTEVEMNLTDAMGASAVSGSNREKMESMTQDEKQTERDKLNQRKWQATQQLREMMGLKTVSEKESF